VRQRKESSGRPGPNPAVKLRQKNVKARIRELLNATPFRPFIIRMADGTAHRIDHPDFVLASSDAPQVVLEAANGDMTYLSVLLIVSVEHAQAAASQP
jgi:hypothetical protein